jgi:polysaccharide export outer membrane protein
VLQTLYSKYYIEPFVTTRVTNNRVFVLGAIGGGTQGSGLNGAGLVIQMANDNMNLLEVLAQAGGIRQGGKAQNIRLIRNYTSQEPMVQIIDLSTIEGMRQASLYIEPNDVVYVEPNQRLFFEVLRDVTPVINTFIALVSTYLLITTVRN